MNGRGALTQRFRTTGPLRPLHGALCANLPRGTTMKFTSIDLARQKAAFAKAAAGCRSPRCFALVCMGCFLGAVTPVLRWYVQRVVDRSDEPLGVIALVSAILVLLVRSRG